MDKPEDAPNEVFRFSWGKKRGIGGVKRNIQFYESFMINDVNYSLYDCVYLYDAKVCEPYIGKLVKIWEQPDQKKKAKILWFFRPHEVQNYLEDIPLEKEIFLAIGEGVGLFNINPLEAIAGKCSVICTSKDERNRQPSSEELEMADYIFYRTFDVKNYTISERIDEQIAGVEAKFLLNQENQQSHSKSEEKCSVNKATPSTSIPSPTCNLGPLKNLEDRSDVKVVSASISTKKNDVMVHRLEELPPLDKNENSKFRNALANKEESTCLSADLAAENIGGGSITKSDLFDNRLPKKARLNDTIEALNDTSLRKHKVELNGPNSVVKESSTIRNDAHENKINKASVAEKDDALVGNSNPKKRLLHASIDASNDAYSRNKRLGSNRDNDTSKEIVHLHKESSEKQNLVQQKAKPLNVSLHENLLIGTKRKSESLEVTGRSDTDRSKWFKNLPWEDRLKKADGQGTLVLVENLDPTYTSSEVEDIIYRTFEKSCTARVIPQTSFQNPNYGQAHLIFKTKEAADLVVSKINNGYLQLPNGSPLISSKGMFKVPKLSLCGHLSIEKQKHLMREMRIAVSTSHCAQPNTIEYEMALEWILHHEQTSRSMRTLHKEQEDELNALRNVRKRLKTK